MSLTCTGCRRTLAGGSKICPFCGTLLPESPQPIADAKARDNVQPAAGRGDGSRSDSSSASREFSPNSSSTNTSSAPAPQQSQTSSIAYAGWALAAIVLVSGGWLFFSKSGRDEQAQPVSSAQPKQRPTETAQSTAPQQPTQSLDQKPIVPPSGEPKSDAVISAEASTSLSPSQLVDAMIEAANRNNEAAVISTKAELDKKEKPARGDRKAARALNDEALAHLRATRRDDAKRSLMQALAADPSDVEVNNNLAYALLELGQLDEAKERLIATLTLVPDRTSAWSNLAAVFAKQGRHEQSVGAFLNAYRFSANRTKTIEFLTRRSEEETDTNMRDAIAATLKQIPVYFPQ